MLTDSEMDTVDTVDKSGQDGRGVGSSSRWGVGSLVFRAIVFSAKNKTDPRGRESGPF